MKKLSIGFFSIALAVFVLLAAAYNFTYEKSIDRAREELAMQKEEQESTVTTEGEALKEDCYFLMEENGYVVVYLSDRSTPYDYTSIEVSSLPVEVQSEVKNGKYIENTRLLYSFLENYSS